MNNGNSTPEQSKQSSADESENKTFQNSNAANPYGDVDPSSALSVISSLFASSTPNNVIKGSKKGIGHLAISSVGAVALIIGTPIKGTMYGYEKGSVPGALAGLIGGTVIGAIGGATLMVVGTMSLLYYTGYGLFRTPETCYSTLLGKEWDDDAKEWIYYDLSAERDKILSISDDEFVRLISSSTNTAAEIFSVSSNTGKDPNCNCTNWNANDSENPENPPKRPKKNIQDRSLYDVLGIEPEATSNEIKKAYYVKARENHPDRNRDDPQANAKFQKVGQAYQILSNDDARAAYDNKGLAAVDSNPSLDANMIYTLIFGSDGFESLIGELELAMKIKSLVTEDNRKKPPELFRFKQRKREILLAVALAKKLDLFVNGEEAVFIEKAKEEAQTLSESSQLGSILLALIGSIYMDRASRTMSSLGYIAYKTSSIGTGIFDTFTTFSYGIQSVYSAYEMKSIATEAEMLQKVEDDKNNVPENERKTFANNPQVNLNVLYGPNPSEERKTKVRARTRNLTSNFLGFLWQLNKSDIKSTLKHVCNKVLRDHSVPNSIIQKRAEGLYALGAEFYSKNANELLALEEFIDKLGVQSGMYGEEPTHNYPTSDPNNNNNNEENNQKRRMEKTEILTYISSIDQLSVKELKDAIAKYDGDYSNCLEKSDLKLKLLTILQEKVLLYDDLVYNDNNNENVRSASMSEEEKKFDDIDTKDYNNSSGNSSNPLHNGSGNKNQNN
eukprot:gene11423-15307_t